MSQRSVSLAWAVLFFVVWICAPGGPGANADDNAEMASDPVRWVTAETPARVGDSMILCIQLPAPAATDREIPVTVEPAGAVDVLAPARVMKGHKLAWIRLRPTTTGDVTLSLADGDGSACMLHVLNAPATASDHVEIVSPAPRAAIWGQLEVGARIGGRPVKSASLWVNETEIADALVDRRTRGGFECVRFRIDAAAVPAGSATLTVRATFIDGGAVASQPLPVRVVHPDAESGQLFEAEAEELANLDLPQEWRYKAKAQVRNDRTASGGKYCIHASEGRPNRILVESETGGWYQVVIRARGSYAGGAFPSVGVFLNDGYQNPITYSPIFHDGWHRLAIGRPIFVPEGKQYVGVRFTNDRYVARLLDRNLYIDRCELLRLDDAVVNEMSGLAEPEGVRIVPTLRLDGRTVSGSFDYNASIAWPQAEKAAPPPVILEINGREIARQHTATARFWVPTSAMQAGTNTLRVIVDMGPRGKVTSAPATFTYVGTGASRFVERTVINAAESGWTGNAVGRLGYDRRAPDRWIFRINANGEVTHPLPADLQGRYNLYLYANADEFEGRPQVRVSQTAGEGDAAATTELKTVEVPRGWRHTHVGQFDFAVGPKSLTAAFINDHYVKDKGDRNFYLGSFELQRVGPEKDETDPSLTVLYPAAGATLGPVDAVVLEAAGDTGMHYAQVLIDGKEHPGATHYMTWSPDHRIAIPISTRGLAGGEHQLQIRVRERSGRIVTSDPIAITASESPADSPFAAAAHFLNRFGYGPEEHALAEVLVDGIETCLRRWLAAPMDADAIRLAVARYWRDDNNTHIAYRPLDTSVWTTNPVRDRLVNFAENHFSTWIQKTGAYREWDEHLRLRALATGRFRDLLRASATSPCMLFYLDQENSFANRINENYAREIMELHTLGVDGGYTQKDVEELTRVITGWSATRERGKQRFAFCPELHDRARRVVVGYEFPELTGDANSAPVQAAALDRGEAALELLVAHPSTATFLARKLVEHYICEPAPADLVERVATHWRATGGDLTEVLVYLATCPEFADDSIATPFEKGTDPWEFGLRVARCGRWAGTGSIYGLLAANDRLPMGRPTPDGYAESEADWFDSGAMLQRWRLVENAANGIRWRIFYGNVRRNQREYTDDWNQALIDCVAVRLLGRLLSPESNDTAMAIMREATGDHNQRVGLAASIVGQLPEANRH